MGHKKPSQFPGHTPEQLAWFKEQGARGGETSSANMSPEQRSERARYAVAVRIANGKKKAARQAKARAGNPE